MITKKVNKPWYMFTFCKILNNFDIFLWFLQQFLCRYSMNIEKAILRKLKSNAFMITKSLQILLHLYLVNFWNTLLFFCGSFNKLSVAILGTFMLKIPVILYMYFNQFPLNVHIVPLAYNLLQWLNNAEE